MHTSHTTTCAATKSPARARRNHIHRNARRQGQSFDTLPASITRRAAPSLASLIADSPREELAALVADLATGAPALAPFAGVWPDPARGNVEAAIDAPFCPPCAAKDAIRQGFAATEIQVEAGPLKSTAGLEFCSTCGVLLNVALDAEGVGFALDDLEGYSWQRPGPRATAREWQLVSLLLPSATKAQWPRIRNLIAALLTPGPQARRPS